MNTNTIKTQINPNQQVFDFESFKAPSIPNYNTTDDKTTYLRNSDNPYQDNQCPLLETYKDGYFVTELAYIACEPSHPQYLQITLQKTDDSFSILGAA